MTKKLKPFSFEGTAITVTKQTGDKFFPEVAVWTDGLALSSDNEELCAYRLKPGLRYKVTVERIDQ